ncbi:MAG: RluA family pseudouridine synthase [Pseudarcicella sp.]|nr:RluA family pseudouridine synthase [Pseudarcicella sp.]MBP6411063.1 RluA family pseudouridine synthase [Pseudarcicella sp.]
MKTNSKATDLVKKDKKNTQSTRLLVTEPTPLLIFLLQKLSGKSRHNVKALLKNKQIKVDQHIVTQFDFALITGQTIEISNEKAPEEQHYKGLKIVFEDEHLIVIEKEEGLLSIATEKQKDFNAYSILSGHVKKQNTSNKIFVIHRLDRETSGIMMFAKSEKVQALMQESWNATIRERTYLAVVEGKTEKQSGTIVSNLIESKALIVYSTQNPSLGQKAITHYETLRQNDSYTLLKVNLETGRKNQIRVHMQDLKHPIVGDKKYGATVAPIGRLGLHAWVLAFTHPITKENLYFETEIPKKFIKLFENRFTKNKLILEKNKLVK